MKLLAATVCCCLVAQAVLGAVLVPGPAERPRANQHLPEPRADEDLYKLPAGMLFGAGVSALQSEGATSEDGKAESVMDKDIHALPDLYPVNNDVAADHYHRYKDDLALAKQLKLTSHRFSISWPRVFPTGNINEPNKAGITFYHNYIDEIKKNGMEPMVTMYHFDHPYTLEQSTNGWTSDAMVDKFVEYADYLFNEYGSKVKYWNPVNEGNMYCIFLPPELALANLTTVDPVTTFYKCVQNTVLAHARTYRLYKTKYFKDQGGKVGTSLLIWPMVADTTNYEDIQAAEIFNQVFAGIMVHPLVHGDFPHSAHYFLGKRSDALGLKDSLLPTFTAAQKDILIKDGPATDFVALNVYNTFRVRWSLEPGKHTPFLEPILSDLPFVQVRSGGGFTNVDPDMMKTAMLWAWNNYHLPLVVTENGYGDTGGQGIHDSSRTEYMSASLRSLARTSNEFGIPVISFHTWSLIDVFEFTFGLTGRPFGLIHVDYKGGSLKRTIKDSAKFFVEIAETGRVPYVAPADTSSVAPSSSSLAPKPTDSLPSSTTPKPNDSPRLTPALSLVLLLAAALRL